MPRLNRNKKIQPPKFTFNRCVGRNLESIISFRVFTGILICWTVSGYIWDFYWNQKGADRNLKPGGGSGVA